MPMDLSFRFAMGSHMRWRGWLIVAAVAAMSGCASLNGNTLSNTQKIKAGMSTGEVTTLLGKPPWTSILRRFRSGGIAPPTGHPT